MSDATVTVRVDKNIHERMKAYEEINWSAVLRKSIDKTLEELEKVDPVRMETAFKTIDRLYKTKSFSKGKNSLEVLREWREKRR